MTATSWVIGAGGLLGSAVVRALRNSGRHLVEAPRLHWGAAELTKDLSVGLERLIATADDDEWLVFWCAGSSVTGSTAAQILGEVQSFETFLGLLSLLPSEVRRRGRLFVASSAGGVYGGARGAPFDETSEPAPLGDYGRGKLAIEAATRSFAEAAEVRCLVGRIANLYGPGQSLAKPQGLISHLSLSSVIRKPLPVFVSLDTLRDYVYVDDCARLILHACERLGDRDEPHFRMKVIASGRAVTIAGLLGEFRHIIGRRPDIIMGTSPQAAQQSRDLRLRSQVWPEIDRKPMVTLVDGIARTLQDIRSSYLARGMSGPRTSTPERQGSSR